MDKDMAQEEIDVLTSNIDTLWVIDCAILVFIMQAGFMCMETGLSRHKNSINVALNIKQLDNITKTVIGSSQNQNLSDDLTLISIGK